jgi:flagellar protein FlaI
VGLAKKRGKLEEPPNPWKGIEVKPVPEEYEVLDRYAIREGLAEVVIATPPGEVPEPTYFAVEVQLTPQEAMALEKLKDILSKELEPPKPGEEEDAKRILLETADKLLKKYERALGRFDEESRQKLFYYLERDMTGFGPLNIIMEDYRIEDVSCDGVNIPVYVWHRDYESIPTNIIFTDRDVLDDYIIQLAHKSEKHISSAFPILDAMIYGKHRLAATFREEISPRGSTFTIRKFREKPFSITELLQSRLLSPEMAAYFWLLIEHKANILVAGATGSGKTTILNALMCFVKPRMKIVTCEETAELNIPTENWVRFVTRESYGLGAQKTGEITLYDLVRTSLRYRPDYLIVGEVRGEEAFVLFQAIASVSWDTPILIRDVQGGEPRLVRIGEFVDQFYEPLEERVPKFINGFEVMTLSKSGEACWKPIRYVLRHKTNKIYKIRYVGGEVRATGSHSVFVLDEDSLTIRMKKVSELRRGDVLVSFLKRRDENSPNPRLDLIEILGDRRKDFVDGLPPSIKALVGRNPVSLATYLEVERSRDTRDNLRIRRWYTGNWIPAVLEVDEDLAFIMGVYLANGCVKEHRGKSLCFSLGLGERDIEERIIRVFWEKFKLKPTIDDRGSYHIVTFNSTILAELFKKLMGGKLEEKHVPRFLWCAPRRVIEAFLSGYAADSHRRVKNGKDGCYVAKKAMLAYEVSWLARVAGLNSYIVREDHAHYGPYYAVYISRLRDGLKPPSADLVPLKPIINLYKRLNPSNMPRRLTQMLNDRRRFVSREKAREVLDWILQRRRREFDDEDHKLLARLGLLLQSDIALAPVLEVVEEDYDGYVYDLSVPETEAFYGGSTPVLLHNTGHGGLSTIHAESIESVMKRLVSPPMNIPPSHIPLLDAVALVERVRLPRPVDGRTYARRMRYVWEVLDYGKYVTIAEWNPATDQFVTNFMDSMVLEKIAAKTAKTKEEIIAEIERRAKILKALVERGMIEISDVAKEVYTYYSNPEQVLRKYGIAVEEIEVPAGSSRAGAGGFEAKSFRAGAWADEDGEAAIAEKVLSLLRQHGGVYPLWRIFVETPASKIMVFRALKRLRESGKIEMSRSMVVLRGG